MIAERYCVELDLDGTEPYDALAAAMAIHVVSGEHACVNVFRTRHGSHVVSNWWTDRETQMLWRSMLGDDPKRLFHDESRRLPSRLATRKNGHSRTLAFSIDRNGTVRRHRTAESATR